MPTSIISFIFYFGSFLTEISRQNHQLSKMDLITSWEGSVGDQELEDLPTDIYRPLFDTGEDEITENDVEGEGGKDRESDEDEVIVPSIHDGENDLERGKDIIII